MLLVVCLNTFLKWKLDLLSYFASKLDYVLNGLWTCWLKFRTNNELKFADMGPDGPYGRCGRWAPCMQHCPEQRGRLCSQQSLLEMFLSPWVLGDAVLDEFGLWLLFVPWSTCFSNCSILAINHSRSRTECAGWVGTWGGGTLSKVTTLRTF